MQQKILNFRVPDCVAAALAEAAAAQERSVAGVIARIVLAWYDQRKGAQVKALEKETP